MASLTNVKDPEISAWLAIMVAAVAMAIPKKKTNVASRHKKD